MSYELKDFFITDHAKDEINRRGISQEDLESCLIKPDQEVEGRNDRTVFHKKIKISSKTLLLRVVVEKVIKPWRVVTVYKTSKIEKYWRS